MLRDENGNLKPFDQFKQEVLKINEKYNVNYLQAEYNMAVQSAQMASKWQDFMAHKDFVNLQYRTAGDEKVRAEHAALDGTTLPVEDKFWNEYLPPLGWNCRCTVVEVPKNSAPVSDSAEAIRVGDAATSKPSEKIFRFNPGKEQKVFPPKHPYFPKLAECKTCKLGKGIGLVKGKDCKKVCKSLEELQNKKADATKQQPRVVAYQEDKDIKQIEKDKNYKPYEPNIYTPVYKDGKDPDEDDFDDKISFAREAVKKGYRVWLLNKTKVDGVKNPDLLLERKGIYKLYDHKRIRSIKSLTAELDDSATQAPRVIIKNTDNNDNPRTIILAISRYFVDHPNAKEVIICQGKRMVSVDRVFCNRDERRLVKDFIRLWK